MREVLYLSGQIQGTAFHVLHRMKPEVKEMCFGNNYWILFILLILILTDNNGCGCNNNGCGCGN